MSRPIIASCGRARTFFSENRLMAVIGDSIFTNLVAALTEQAPFIDGLWAPGSGSRSNFDPSHFGEAQGEGTYNGVGTNTTTAGRAGSFSPFGAYECIAGEDWTVDRQAWTWGRLLDLETDEYSVPAYAQGEVVTCTIIYRQVPNGQLDGVVKPEIRSADGLTLVQLGPAMDFNAEEATTQVLSFDFTVGATQPRLVFAAQNGQLLKGGKSIVICAVRYKRKNTITQGLAPCTLSGTFLGDWAGGRYSGGTGFVDPVAWNCYALAGVTDVFVNLGANGASVTAEGVPNMVTADRYEAEMRELISRIRSYVPAAVFWLSPPYEVRSATNQAAMRALLESYADRLYTIQQDTPNCVFLDWLTVCGTQARMSAVGWFDGGGVHPSAAGIPMFGSLWMGLLRGATTTVSERVTYSTGVSARRL